MSEYEQFEWLLDRYDLKEPVVVTSGNSGMNNTTRMVAAGEQRYVLRIYNNHRDADIVALEHEVLEKLGEQRLSFQVPAPVANRRGDSITRLDNGALAALFRYIDGERPSSGNAAHVEALGAAAGELSAALERLQVGGKPQYSPYYKFGKTYAELDGTIFVGLAERSGKLAARRADFLLLQEERERLEQSCGAIARLPQQWIHGDLVFNNAVSRGDSIAGLLDFEFAAIDARAMELAVIAVDLLRPSEPECLAQMISAARSFRSKSELTEEERQLLPTMMKLRLLDVALHFAVRYRDGLDGEDVFGGILDHSVYGCKWLDEHRPAF